MPSQTRRPRGANAMHIRVSTGVRELRLARRLGKDHTLWWEVSGILIFLAAIAAVILFVH